MVKNCLQTPALFCGFVSNSNSNNKIRKPSISEADVLLAKEMNELSVAEREHVLEEVHGVADVIQETPVFVSQQLGELDQEISNIRKRSAYERALFLSPRYVRDPKLRLMFLRAEYFDARKAAKRMVLYFECKRVLWGDGKLVKAISLYDFDEEDMRSLRAGSMQNPGVKDQAGRTLCFICQNYSKYKTWKNQVRQYVASHVIFHPCTTMHVCSLLDPFSFILVSSHVVSVNGSSRGRRYPAKRNGIGALQY
jgi:hypothetical protein